MNPRKLTPKHTVVKMLKIKDKGRILKVAKATSHRQGYQLIIQQKLHRSEWSEWHDISKVLKEKNL